MGRSSGSSGGGSSRGSRPNNPPPSVMARRSYVTTPSGRPIFTSRGDLVRVGSPNRNRDNNNDRGGGGGNNNPMPQPISQQPVPPPTIAPPVDDGTGSGKVINPTIFLLQREQRNRRLGRNFFSLLGVQDQFTGARRNILF